jgi:DNA-binding response OmpR family regulator
MNRSAKSTFAGRRVLVAEDQLLIAQLIDQFLSSLGCEMIGPARTTAEALAAIRAHELDGALLDLHFDGETCEPAARELARRGIPFIVISGAAKAPAEPSGLLAEAPRLTKPFTVRQLEDIMSRTFCRREAGQRVSPDGGPL